MAAIPDDDVSDIADTLPVHKNSADRYGLNLLSAGRGHLQDVTVLENEAVFRRHADLLGELTVSHEMAVFSMNRNKIARPSQSEHRFELLLTGMARHVNLRHLFIVDLGAAPVKVIDQIGDRLLIARDEL